MNHKSLLMIFLLAGLWAACGGQSPQPIATTAPAAKLEVEGGSYTNVTPQQLAQMLKQKDFFFVNVHIPYEGEIEPTDAKIPYDQTAQHLKLMSSLSCNGADHWAGLLGSIRHEREQEIYPRVEFQALNAVIRSRNPLEYA